MQKQSAGILAYRILNTEIEVLLVHPGGPFFIKKDVGVWSVPKGENDCAEDLWIVAKREFEEETGNVIKSENGIPLKPVKTKAGKIVNIFAVDENFENPFLSSNNFEIEWPPRSGKRQTFPEVDKAEWLSIKSAGEKIYDYQKPLLDELDVILKRESQISEIPDNAEKRSGKKTEADQL